MKHKRLMIAATAVIVSSSSQAVILTPGVFTPLPGTLGPSGTVVEDVLQSFSFAVTGGTISGQVQNRVVKKADNTYLFEWKISNNATSAGNIQDLRLGNFISTIYDGDWENPSLGDTPPTQAFLFNLPGGLVNFNFNQATNPGGVASGKSSKFFYLNTTATSYGKVAGYDLTNIGQSASSGAFSTFAPVPEPASFAVLGLGGLALLRRKKAR